jgi:D-glycero-alpha-D-manno-heptose-7-phosphate kinase
VGLLGALHALKGEMAGPMQLAQEAIRVERDLCRENVGSQDQVTVAFGGFNHITFSAGDLISVHPVMLPKARLHALQANLMLLFMGGSRMASEIADEQIRNISHKISELETLQQMVGEGLKIITHGKDLAEFGRLLHEGWKIKKTLSSKISNSAIDEVYSRAMTAGALGGKLCGAGGGWFLLLFAPPETHQRIRDKLPGCLHVPFEFEKQGSQIIFFQPDRDK